jgi:transglutaminase-like putative cysteine protease
VSSAEGSNFPYSGEDEKILGAMQPNRCLQSDDERVIKLAKKAIGNTKDTEEAVRKIESFVADYLVNKGLSVGYATAIEVIESKQGDCTEYAVLSAAMCRAVGIPSRVVMGLAYVEHYMGLEHRFGGHAWTEAYVGGKWIGIDSAFKGAGLGGYGPGHIALATGNGNPENFFAIANSMGQFKIEKVEVVKK